VQSNGGVLHHDYRGVVFAVVAGKKNGIKQGRLSADGKMMGEKPGKYNKDAKTAALKRFG
jgi:hypothetical protein